ncbi:3-ketoacyl-CoA thiolase @ Acetyl-CoA acetyltransferase [hydrothermal vent metagenome]|uniref:3-ketoacyl-CoA thiolase @ Acetyl-CoA acetyltransferase n=1 Tax=hydrothermal vent metagenome TaxID=652676 RepID=A0A3B0RHU6_9ZZZZ
MSVSAQGYNSRESGIGVLFDDIYIIDGKRTPFGKFTGSLSTVSPTDLGILASKAALEVSGIEGSEVDQVITSNIGQANSDCFFLPRHIALYAGTPLTAPAVLVQRICGSGVEVLGQAAEQIALGKANVVLGCGTDVMSRYPLVSYSARQGFPLGRPQYVDLLWEALNDTAAVPMGRTADNLAARYNLSREEVDAYAFRSQNRYVAAKEAGFFDGEITEVPARGVFEMDALIPRKYKCANRDGLSHDEHPRQTSMENLAKLKPVFSKDGPTTAGNASGIVDGAAAILVASGDYVRAHGIEPIGKIRGFSSAGVEPDYMGIGPVPAIRSLLDALDMKVSDIDRYEINEAFSAQVLSCARELDIDEDTLNVNGGAVALGHPLGVTGLRLAHTALRTLKRDDKQFGVASACIGGGQGIAMVVERC